MNYGPIHGLGSVKNRRLNLSKTREQKRAAKATLFCNKLRSSAIPAEHYLPKYNSLSAYKVKNYLMIFNLPIGLVEIFP